MIPARCLLRVSLAVLAVALTGCRLLGAPSETGRPSEALASTPPRSPSSTAPPSGSPAALPSSTPLPTELAELDVVAALSGRAVAGIDGELDVLYRIGLPPLPLPAGERVLTVSSDRVLALHQGRDAGVEIVIRNLAGEPIARLGPPMAIPQVGYARGQEVWVAGAEGDLSLPFDQVVLTDGGLWHGTAAGWDSQPVIPPGDSDESYGSLEVSPDGTITAVYRCRSGGCQTVINAPEGDVVVDAPRVSALVGLTNDTAISIVDYDSLVGHAVSDGAERWTKSSDGLWWTRYALSDGSRFVVSELVHAEGRPTTEDIYAVYVIDGSTGTVERRIEVPLHEQRWTLHPSLSTDRYAVLGSSPVPGPEAEGHQLLVVDLEAGAILDLELRLGPAGG